MVNQEQILFLPPGLPAVETLCEEGARVSDTVPTGVRPLRILLLNLMPQKAVTELDIARMMVQPGMAVEFILIKISGQSYKTTPQAYMDTFYRDFEQVEQEHFDGLIVTGAPVEHLPFEEVRYWPQLCHIMDWAVSHVAMSLYICWGAQAALYHRYGIPKYILPAKKFGVFPQRVLVPTPLMDDLAPEFPMPNSRHTEVRRTDIERHPLTIVAEGEESGVGVMTSLDGREVYIVGHLEYGADTLRNEYLRDLSKGLPIQPPLHYFEEDRIESGVNFSWQTAARTFYRNWLLQARRHGS